MLTLYFELSKSSYKTYFSNWFAIQNFIFTLLWRYKTLWMMTHCTAIYLGLLSVLTASHFWSLCNQSIYLADSSRTNDRMQVFGTSASFLKSHDASFYRSIVWSWLMIWIRKYNENLHQNLVVEKIWMGEISVFGELPCWNKCSSIYCVWICCNTSS